MESTPKHHVVLFPYLAKGHMIPVLQLARFLLRRRSISVTVFTTPQNQPFVSQSLSGTSAAVLTLPFAHNIPGVPADVESTDKLPSVSLYMEPFTRATKVMQPDLERALESLPRVSFMVSDGFLWWTLETAKRFGFPRLVFFGMSCYASCVCMSVRENKLLPGPNSDAEPITVPEFPWIKITKSDFGAMFSDLEPKSSKFELFQEQVTTMEQSHGLIVNSFYELEPVFVDYYTLKGPLKQWCVGPLVRLAEPLTKETDDGHKPTWIKWLDHKLDQGCAVLYVAFGSQAEISDQQLKEIANGLEKSNVNFLWLTRKTEAELGEGFEERVGDREMVVREWVDQRGILSHRCVEGFLSHCGLNSTMESICAGVPILAWPLAADQPLNARMVAEEIKVGLRVEACDGTATGFVRAEEVAEKARELMEGEKGKQVRKRVKEYAEMAKAALEEGTGSSWRSLEQLIEEVSEGDKKGESRSDNVGDDL